MPDISFTDVATLPLPDHWRVAEQNAELVLAEQIDKRGDDSETCQIQFRLMKVAAKSPEQQQQLLLSALDTAEPERVSDTVCWTRENEIAEDEEGLMQRWLMAVTKEGGELSLIIVDLSVPAGDKQRLEQVSQEIEAMLNKAV